MLRPTFGPATIAQAPITPIYLRPLNCARRKPSADARISCGGGAILLARPQGPAHATAWLRAKHRPGQGPASLAGSVKVRRPLSILDSQDQLRPSNRPR